MAITLVNSISGSTAFVGTTGTTISLSALTLQPDDFLVFSVVGGVATLSVTWSAYGNNGGTGNSTTIGNRYQNSTNDTNLGVFLIQQGTTVDTNIALSSTDTSSHGCAWMIFQYRGVDTTTPQATSVPSVGGSKDLPDPPSITSANGSKIVAIYSASQSTTTGTVWTTPTDVNNFIQQMSPNKGRLAMADQDSTGVAFNPAALTGGEGLAADSWAAFTIALKVSTATALGNRFGFWFMTHP